MFKKDYFAGIKPAGEKSSTSSRGLQLNLNYGSDLRLAKLNTERFAFGRFTPTVSVSSYLLGYGPLVSIATSSCYNIDKPEASFKSGSIFIRTSELSYLLKQDTYYQNSKNIQYDLVANANGRPWSLSTKLYSDLAYQILKQEIVLKSIYLFIYVGLDKKVE